MKTELGRVYYLTTMITFPMDKDQWIKQEPIAGASTFSIYRFIKNLNITDEHKQKLCKNLETSWKDNQGVWIQLRIETTKRNDKWGDTSLKMKVKH